MVAKVRIIEEYFLKTLSGHQTAVVQCGETVDPGLPVLLLGNVGLVEDLSQDVEDHEDKPATEQRSAAFTAEELSCPRNVGVPPRCGGDVSDGEEHGETVSPGHQTTNFAESVHDQRETLGADWSTAEVRDTVRDSEVADASSLMSSRHSSRHAKYQCHGGILHAFSCVVIGASIVRFNQSEDNISTDLDQ